MIRSARRDDLPAICAIVNEVIATSIANFHIAPESLGDWEARFTEGQERYPWLVEDDQGRILGFAKASAYKKREAYDALAETTIYLASDAQGRGLGTRLYTALLDRLPDCGVRAALGVIALPHPESVALHEKLGFKASGLIPRAGRKFDRDWDVGFWWLELTPAAAEPRNPIKSDEGPIDGPTSNPPAP